MSWFACKLAVHQDYPVYFYKDSGNGTTSNPRRNIVVGNFVSRVPIEAEMIILLFVHGGVDQTRLQYVRQDQQSYEAVKYCR
jgi:hypothetical protein